MLKKLITLLLLSIFTVITVKPVNADTIRIDQLKGLQRNPKADSIEDGAHDQFDNTMIYYGNLQAVKGRNRLNSTAHTDIVVNGQWYYENQAGTTKKLVVAESDELVTYDVDGTNRTSIANTLTNEKWDAHQFGDTLYLTSSTNGLYKWTGTGSATVVGSVAAPSSVDFAATTGDGGLTTGQPILVSLNRTVDTSCNVNCESSTTAVQGACAPQASDDVDGNNVTSDTGTNTVAATTVTYNYKIVKQISTTGSESEPSSADAAILTGDVNFSWLATGCDSCDSSNADTTCDDFCCSGIEYTTNGKQTRTVGTLASTPSAPFDSYCIYRTVAGGSDYFLLGCVKGGGSTYNDGKPDVSLSTPLDTTVDTIAPPSFRYIEEYKGAIFVAENDTVKFSRLPTSIVADADTYWLDTDELQVTGNITGLKKASDSLIIFTSTNIYQVVGFGATSFRLIPIIIGVGAVSDETIEVDTNGDVYFFSGASGVYKLSVGQQQVDSLSGSIVDNKNAKLVKISSPNMDNIFRGEDTQIALTTSDYTLSHAYYDSDNDWYFLYIGNRAFMFNATNNTWSHIPATSMLASVYRKSPNALGTGVLLDNAGFFFNNWTGYENGIESGTVTGLPTSSTNNTLTCSTCTFNTTNDGLKGLWIYIENENKEYHQITSNTGTMITISDTWTTNPITSDTFYVAYIIPKWRTKQYSFIKPPDESKVFILYVNHNKSESEQVLDVFSFQEKATIGVYAGSKDLSSKFIDVFNTRMRSSWVQWEFRTYVYNTSNTVDPPLDIVSYAVDAEAEKAVNRNG